MRAKNSQSVSMVEKLCCAISHEHKKLFLPSPTDHPSIRLIMRAIRRKFSQPRRAVEPLTPAHLLAMNRHLAQLGSDSSLELWRTIWRNNLQYYSACRFSEINELLTSDVTIQTHPNNCLILRIRKSKTDQLHQGVDKHVHAVPEETLLCPVRLTQLYLSRLRIHLPPGVPYKGYLQPRVRFDHTRQLQIPLATQKISYSSCLDETRKLLQTRDISGRFGEHSGRRGAATQAAANGGTLIAIQTLGGWKSSNNAQKYIDQRENSNPLLSKLLLPKSL